MTLWRVRRPAKAVAVAFAVDFALALALLLSSPSLQAWVSQVLTANGALALGVCLPIQTGIASVG